MVAVWAVIYFFLKALAIQNTPYTIMGFFCKRKFKPAKNNHKYAILIPARNEENVIGNLIASIKKQDYPSHLITIFVVADNCTDKTATVARKNGAICYEHFNPDERTKGFALKYLFEQIERDYGIQSFEGYFIFDSDNLLKYDYITRMNEAFDEGEKIITSYRSTKNWNESWIASTYALHWLRSIRFRHRARSFLHLATNIQGTGFLFSSEIVKDGWKYTSLTEDRALTADSVVQGYEITYNDDAIFYDEQPVSLKIALRQRLRWSKGHLQAFAESGWGLFRNIFVDKNTKREEGESFRSYLLKTIRHRFMSFDTFGQLIPKNIFYLAKWLTLDLILNPLIMYSVGGTFYLFNGKTVIAMVIHYFFGEGQVDVQPGFTGYLLSLAATLWIRLLYRMGKYLVSMLIAIYIFIVEKDRMMHISLPRKILYSFTWPTFDIIGRYTQYVALFKKVDWKPIPHNSTVTIEDLDGIEKDKACVGK